MTTQGALVVIFNEDKSQIMLIKREDFRIWVPPGGRIEAGETSAEAAIREALEETGYRVVLDDFIGEYRRPQINDGVNHLFAGHLVGGDGGNRSWEALDVQWFPVDELPKRMLQHTREMIEDARFATKLPLQRTQFVSIWVIIMRYVALKIRAIRNWWMGR